jgi:hypothetical protein
MKSKFSSVLVAGAVLSLAGLVGLEVDAQVAAVRPAGADLLQTAAGIGALGGCYRDGGRGGPGQVVTGARGSSQKFCLRPLAFG